MTPETEAAIQAALQALGDTNVALAELVSRLEVRVAGLELRTETRAQRLRAYLDAPSHSVWALTRAELKASLDSNFESDLAEGRTRLAQARAALVEASHQPSGDGRGPFARLGFDVLGEQCAEQRQRQRTGAFQRLKALVDRWVHDPDHGPAAGPRP